MKRFLLFAAVVVIALSASAQKSINNNLPVISTKMMKTLNHEGKQMTATSVKHHAPKKVEEATTERTINEIPATAEKSAWTQNYYTSTWLGMAIVEGAALDIYTEGNNVYFDKLFNSAYYLPVVGEKQADGSIVIKKQKVYEGIDYYGDGSEYDDLYFTLIEVDDEDNTTFPDDDIVLKPNNDGSYTLGGTEEAPIYYGLCDQYGYYWALNANLEMAPFTPATPAVTVPQNAEKSDVAINYCFDNGDKEYINSNIESMYTLGNDVYVEGLCPNLNGVLKGSIVDGKLVIPTNQFLGYDNYYYVTYEAGDNYKHTYTEIDPENYEYDESITYDPADALIFQFVDNAWVLNENQCIIERLTSGDTYGIYHRLRIKAYTGDTPAVPADPWIEITDMTESYGQWVISTDITNCDVNGDYINPEKMAIAVWVDDEILTFTEDDGYTIEEDIDWMPYGWCDLNGGYDIGFKSLSQILYLYIDLFDKLGLQVSYTVDGVTNYSNIYYSDAEGNIEVVAPSTTSISTVSSNKAATVKKLIENGSIVIKKNGHKYTLQGVEK